MAKEYAAAFYNSRAWKKCRASYIAERIAIDGGMCEICQQELGYIVHHREWITPSNINDPDVTLNHSNLQYVCQCCHNQIEDGEQSGQQYIFDADGQIVPIPPKK